jgi:hypothetical protein
MRDMSRERVDAVLREIESVREDILQFDPPWMEPAYEDLRIAIDRRLRSVELGIAKLFEEGAA